MSRRPRFVLPGVPHHVTQRGNNRQNVFFSDADRARYIQILGEHARRHGANILGWCLMTNHVHLVVIPGAANSLALTLGQAHAQYSMEQNRRRDSVGHLWQNRFYSCPLDDAHLLAALHYVDVNPLRAGIIAQPLNWRWSSARSHSLPQYVDEFLDWPWVEWIERARLGVWSHAEWKACLASTPPPAELNRMRRATKLGEPLGSDAFVQEMEAKAGRRLRVLARGRPVKAKLMSSDPFLLPQVEEA